MRNQTSSRGKCSTFWGFNYSKTKTVMKTAWQGPCQGLSTEGCVVLPSMYNLNVILHRLKTFIMCAYNPSFRKTEGCPTKISHVVLMKKSGFPVMPWQYDGTWWASFLLKPFPCWFHNWFGFHCSSNQKKLQVKINCAWKGPYLVVYHGAKPLRSVDMNCRNGLYTCRL